MTNAHSKIKVCEENYPWPRLSKTQELALMKKCITNAAKRDGKKSRMNKSSSFTYEIVYNYDRGGFVVKFEYLGNFARGRK